MSYLKHKDTGEVFPANEHLMKRGDMIPCNLDGSLIDAPAAEADKPRRGRPRVKKEDELNDDLAGLDDLV